jgi:hypothetical protein
MARSMRLAPLGLVALLLTAAGCGGSDSSRSSPSAAVGDATYMCALADMPYDTEADQLAAKREGERIFQTGQKFRDTERNRSIAKAATQVLAALGAPDHTPSSAEVRAGLIGLTDAVAALRTACR